MYNVVSKRVWMDRNGEEQVNWHNVGIALLDDAGKVTRIKLNSMPLADSSGEVWVSLFPRDRDTKAAPM